MSLRRVSLVALVSLCAFAGGVLLSTPAALALTPPVVEEEAVLDAAGTSATLRARIDPEGSETTYRFEYGTSDAYGSSIPIPDGLVGSGTVGVTVSAHPQDLLSSTTYHYRVVAVVASRRETVVGGDGTFTTQPAGSEFALPDGRQWELVSPANKHGALIWPLSLPGLIHASESGDGIVYSVNLPMEAEPPGYTLEASVHSERSARGWSSRDIATPHSSATESGAAEYQFFVGDLSAGFAYPKGEDATLLSSEASELTPYVRRESLCNAPASVGECYRPLLTGKNGFADVPAGTEFGKGRIELEGASPDLSHVVLSSNVALTATPIPPETSQLYEWSADAPADEALQLVSVLPASEGGGPATGYVDVGLKPGRPWGGGRHAISDDGSRIFWETGVSGSYAVYMRDTVKGETVRLDMQQPGVPSGGTPYTNFQIASSDGSKVFFANNESERRLSPQSGAREYDLYECEIVEEAGKSKCDLTDLTPEIGGKPAEMQGMVLGASEDGSYVYFVANGVLGDGAERGATQGTCSLFGQSTDTCNLYEYHDGATTFVAALSKVDQSDWGDGPYGHYDLARLSARVSPDGRYVTFMSNRPLTGYDTRDVASGKPDLEVYLYDAVSKRVVCVSCNPTGSRPVGVEGNEFEGTAARQQNIVGVIPGYTENRVAANVPPGNEIGVVGEGLYQPRALSDDGRLFFNSIDALVPQDVNAQEDVYEFEPEGVGGCSVSSLTFNPKSGGCVGLVSSGTSPEEAGFLDASVGGGDVFFLTMSHLTAQDYDTSLDVYDAHECSASVPCVQPPVPAPPCSSGDSCKTAPSPQPSIFGAPPSATFTGAGNVARSPAKPVVRRRSSTRAQKLVRALRACHKKPRKRRAPCERWATKRYGAKGAHKAVSTMRKGQG